MDGTPTGGASAPVRGLVAAGLSALVPGGGQWYAGRKARAVASFVPLIVAGVFAASLLRGGTVAAASRLVDTRMLLVVALGSLAIAVWRAAVVVDAYRVTTPRRYRSSSLPVQIGVGLLALVVAIPHVLGVAYAFRARRFLETVFTADDVDFSSEIAPPEVGLDPPFLFLSRQTTAVGALHRFLPGDDRQGAFDDPRPLRSLSKYLPLKERLPQDRLTILLVGGDAGPGREGLRTDTMIVMTVDLETGATALFGLPRNFKEVPLPPGMRRSFVGLEKRVREYDLTDADDDGYPDAWTDLDGDGIPDEPPFESCRCFPDMLNKVHRETEDWTDRYPNTPDPGMAALRDIISYLIDLPIDYYVLVDMGAYVDLIDAIGGVDVLVDKPMHVTVSAPKEGSPKASISVEPGWRHLDGLQALAWSRWRRGSSDYARMKRQRCLVRSAIANADPLDLFRRLPAILDVLEDSVVTDVPLNALPDLVEQLATIEFDDITTVGFVPPRYNTGRTPKRYPIPNVTRIRRTVAAVLAGDTSPGSTSDGTSECGF